MYKTIQDFENYAVSSEGVVVNQKFNRQLAQCINSDGYVYVELWKDGRRYKKTVHRLVATAFIQNPDNKPMVNHLDGDRRNNHLDNLEWATNQENIDHGNIRRQGKKLSKKKIMKLYKRKRWDSVEEFVRAIMCL